MQFTNQFQKSSTNSLPEVNKKVLKINSINVEECISLNQLAFYNHYNTIVDFKNEKNDVIDGLFTRCSSYQKIINILARLFYYWKMKTIDSKNDFYSAQIKAESKIISYFQKKEKTYLDKFNGGPYYKGEENGLIVLYGRKTPQGKTKLKLIPPKTILYKRICQFYHKKFENQSSQYVAAAIINAGYYLPGVVKTLKAIQSRCSLCRRRKLKTDPQEMGMLQSHRLIPSKPFLHVQMDLSGPHFVKDYANQKAPKRKCYILVTICCYTRAISLGMLESLSKEHLMCGIEAQFARYGKSKTIESDFGTNFTSLATNIQEKEANDALKFIELELQSKGCSLIQRSPKAPWIQGSAEHSVKLMKQSLKVFKSPMNTFKWTQTLERVMNIVNRRPIGMKTSMEVITPADLNPYHSGVEGTIESDISTGNIGAYYQLQMENIEMFKNKWLELYQRSILAQKKWTEHHNNIEENDLVLILDMVNEFGYPSIAKVVLTRDDSSGTVRYYSVSHKTKKGKDLSTIVRTSQSLVLVLKAKEDHTVENFDIPTSDIDGNIDKNSNTEKLKVTVPKTTDDIIDIL